ncbi:Zinc-binding oxidoreductase alcohol dehydrogenase [Diplodia intermedia]|uniref:Zinc-binding oxidoreductase alcohol dehydrogenase n=1 Tax=Diplodia intermedia TaxID=856260 RepID=A0ABR3T2V2_9PEZI
MAATAAVRSPAWSPDGSTVVYERVGFAARPMESKPLYGWDGDWECRFADVFPRPSPQGRLVLTQKQLGNSSVVAMDPDGKTGEKVVFDSSAAGEVDVSLVTQGLAGAFQPAWSPDGEWVAFGLGQWFQARATAKAKVYRATANGCCYEALTDGTWGVCYLTNATDNLPAWSTDDGERVVFTRKTRPTKFDTFQPYGQIMSMNADGSNKTMLTDSLWEDSMPLYVPNDI